MKISKPFAESAKIFLISIFLCKICRFFEWFRWYHNPQSSKTKRKVTESLFFLNDYIIQHNYEKTYFQKSLYLTQ